jgi:hypothetical protein
VKCPNCKKEMNEIIVNSLCTQVVAIDDKGIVFNWGTPEVQDTTGVFCDYCDYPLTLVDNSRVVIEQEKENQND